MGVTLKINNVDRTGYCQTAQPSFTLPTKGERGSSEFVLQIPVGSSWLADPDTHDDLPGQSVEWLDSGTSVWRGTIDNWRRLPIGDTDWFRLHVAAVTLEQKLDKIRVTRAFAAGSTAGDIVNSIMATEAADEGISIGSVSDGVTFDKPKIFEYARVSDIFAELARLSEDYIVYVKDAALYFEPRTTISAPVSITGLDILSASNPDVSLDRSEYRNRQTVKINEANLILEREIFQGDDATTEFTLSKSIREIVNIFLTTDTPLEIVGTFHAVPADGDAIEAGTWTYTFVDVMPDTSGLGFFQTAQNYVLIGRGNFGTILEDTISNLIACLLDTGEGRGEYYSITAIKNSFVDGAVGDTETITITTGRGAYANTVGFVSFNEAVFTWGDPTSTGESGADSEQSVVEASNIGASDFDWSYESGGNVITLGPDRNPPASDQKVVVEYKPIGFGFVTAEATSEIALRATAEGDSGIYWHLAYREDLMTADEGLAAAAALLRSNATFAKRVKFDTRQHQLRPGMMVPIAASRLGVDVTFLIQSVVGKAIGPNALNQHFRYSILAVSGTQTYIDFWLGLMNKGSGMGGTRGGGTSGVSVQKTNKKKTSEGDIVGWSANFRLADDTTEGENVAETYVPVTGEGKAYMGYVTVVSRGDADAIFDVQYSPDNKANWYSLFGPNDNDKIVIPAAYLDQSIYLEQNPPLIPIENFRDVNIKAGWILRLDCLQSGGATGLSFWLHGKPAGTAGGSLNGGLSGNLAIAAA